MNKIKILIGEAILLYREGLINFLKDEPGISIIGEAADGVDLMQKYEIFKPDLVVTNISLPVVSGADAFKKLKDKYPFVKALFLSMFYDDSYEDYITRIGGMGLVGLDISQKELLIAVTEVYHGRQYFTQRYDELKIKEIIRKYNPNALVFKYDEDVELTIAERIVLEYIKYNLSTTEIAKKMGSTQEIVNIHRSDIMRKLDITNNSALTRFAVLYGVQN